MTQDEWAHSRSRRRTQPTGPATARTQPACGSISSEAVGQAGERAERQGDAVEQQQETPHAISDLLRDHAQNPRHNHPLSQFSGHAAVDGTCGDSMEIWVQVQRGMVRDVGFRANGCAISHACGSMATCLALGKTYEEIEELTPEHIVEAFGGIPADHEHCAQLAINTLLLACSTSDELAEDATVPPAAASRTRRRVFVRVAVPVAAERITLSHSRCDYYALVDIDPETMQALRKIHVQPPSEGTPSLPLWLQEHGVRVLICEDLDEETVDVCAGLGIYVVSEHVPQLPEYMIPDFIAGNLFAPR